MGKLILVGGGARSGKSRFALELARATGERRVFIATAQASDEEMSQRIARHRDERGGDFVTREVPVDLPGAISVEQGAEVIVVDCLTLWLANLLMGELDDGAIEERVEALVMSAVECRATVVLVSNEVGFGIVPENALARRFRDLAGRAHQQIAGRADEVYLAAMGMIVRLLPGPVVAMRPTSGRPMRR